MTSADEANARVEAAKNGGRSKDYTNAPRESFELDAETIAKYAALKASIEAAKQ